MSLDYTLALYGSYFSSVRKKNKKKGQKTKQKMSDLFYSLFKNFIFYHYHSSLCAFFLNPFMD